jgi:predicted N-acetyltransferase YhbS
LAIDNLPRVTGVGAHATTVGDAQAGEHSLFTDLLDNRAHLVLVAEDDGKVIGYLAGSTTEAGELRRRSAELERVLLHVVNHGTDHRAQLLRSLHDLGLETSSQDYIFYVYEHP